MVRCTCGHVFDDDDYTVLYDFYVCRCGMFVTGDFLRYLSDYGFDLCDFYGDDLR